MGKAVIFSLASLLIVILFVASTSLNTKFRISESETEVTRIRVELLNSVIDDFENSYFEKMLYISSKNALVGISRYYYNNDFGSDVIKKNLNLALNDVLYQGILNNGGYLVNLSKTKDLNYSYTMIMLVSNISRMMDKLGLEMTEFNVSISPTNGIEQHDPWTLQVTGEFRYFISDKEGLVSWKGFTTKTVNVSVIGLYLYDRENGDNSISNKGIITSSWKLDNGTQIREDSVLSKLNGKKGGVGLCNCEISCYCIEN
jgi:hypothetical protein